MIDILMATYNGEKYLEEQLESILNQSFCDWRLIVADDCSSDNTVPILLKYQREHQDKIFIYVNECPSGSAKNNFFKLLDKSKSEYIMLADQDDIWLKDKVKITYDTMLRAEKENGKDKPLLVHTDLCVVDKDLSIINKSLFSMQNMDFRNDKLNNILVSNIVTGCTSMFNKALLGLINVKPRKAVMHDMWLGLVAAAFGRIYFINKATILYRQHGFNSNGVKDYNSFNYILYNIFNLKTIRTQLEKQYNQAEEFLEIFEENLSYNQVMLIKSFCNLQNLNFIKRIILLKKYMLFKNGLIRKLGQIFC